jgi:hypothetical protein
MQPIFERIHFNLEDESSTLLRNSDTAYKAAQDYNPNNRHSECSETYDMQQLD